MRLSSDKFIFTMMNTKVFIISYINQSIIGFPAIGMDNTFKIDFTPYNPL